MTDGDCAYHGEHQGVYTIVESVCCVPEASIALYVDCILINIFRKVSSTWADTQYHLLSGKCERRTQQIARVTIPEKGSSVYGHLGWDPSGMSCWCNNRSGGVFRVAWSNHLWDEFSGAVLFSVPGEEYRRGNHHLVPEWLSAEVRMRILLETFHGQWVQLYQHPSFPSTAVGSEGGEGQREVRGGRKRKIRFLLASKHRFSTRGTVSHTLPLNLGMRERAWECLLACQHSEWGFSCLNERRKRCWMFLQWTRQSYVVGNIPPEMPVMPLLRNIGGPHKESLVLTCPPRH